VLVLPHQALALAPLVEVPLKLPDLKTTFCLEMKPKMDLQHERLEVAFQMLQRELKR
jgi:hypothetical protein